MSVRQHSGTFNVHQSVTAYLLHQSVQCAARGCNSCGKVCHICVACMTRTNAYHWIPYRPTRQSTGFAGRHLIALCFPRTSHHPVTFCAFHKAVLIPVFAFRCFNCIYYRRVRSPLSTANRYFPFKDPPDACVAANFYFKRTTEYAGMVSVLSSSVTTSVPSINSPAICRSVSPAATPRLDFVRSTV